MQASARILPIVLGTILGTSFLAKPKASESAIWLFDMGTESSPVADGYIRITPESLVSAQKGYGNNTIVVERATPSAPPKQRVIP